MVYDIVMSGRVYCLELEKKDEKWQCRLDGREMLVQAVQISADTISVLIGGKSFEVKHESGVRGRLPYTGGGIGVLIRGTRYEGSVADPRSWRGRRRALQGEAGPERLGASRPGRVCLVRGAADDAR